MTCDESRIYLEAYMDDELDVAQILRMRSHLAECADCRRAQNNLLGLRAVVRDPELCAEPSVDFADRIGSEVRRAANQESRTWLWRRSLVLATAAVLLIAMGVGAILALKRGTSAPDQLIAGAAVAEHIRSLQPGHLLDVPSSVNQRRYRTPVQVIQSAAE